MTVLRFASLLIAAGVGAASLGAAAEPRLRIPPEFKRLYRDGNVKLEFYDPMADPMRFPGKTSSDFNVQTRHEFEYRYVARGNRRFVRIRPRVNVISSEFRNTVLLPESYQGNDMWQTKLMRHEMDHVAISADPRVGMLTNRVLTSVGVLERPVDQAQRLDNEALNEIVNEELTRRRNAVYELVEKNNRRLDDVTRHGAIKLDDRDAFFRGLYSKESLDEMQFPYLGDVLGLLKEKTYEDAKLLHHAGEDAR